MKLNERLTLVTSFNKRLSEDPRGLTYNAVESRYPDLDFYVYHENSFDNVKGNGIIDFKERENCYTFDIFKENDWLAPFLKESEFNKCHTMGTPGTFDPPNYWKRNAIFWFRKIVALNSVIEHCKTDLLIWLDCDLFFTVDDLKLEHPEEDLKSFSGKRKFDDKLVDWSENHDVVSIKRSDNYTETGFIVFNMKNGGTEVIKLMMDFYRSGEVFNHPRWDDCYCIDYITKQNPHIKFGGLTSNFGSPFDITEYMHHYKKGIKFRDNGEKGV